MASPLLVWLPPGGIDGQLDQMHTHLSLASSLCMTLEWATHFGSHLSNTVLHFATVIVSSGQYYASVDTSGIPSLRPIDVRIKIVSRRQEVSVISTGHQGNRPCRIIGEFRSNLVFSGGEPRNTSCCSPTSPSLYPSPSAPTPRNKLRVLPGAPAYRPRGP